MEWEVRVLEKGRVTLPQELRDRLGLKKGDRLRFLLEKDMVMVIKPEIRQDVVTRTKGLLKGVEPELSPDELEEALLAATSMRMKG